MFYTRYSNLISVIITKNMEQKNGIKKQKPWKQIGTHYKPTGQGTII